MKGGNAVYNFKPLTTNDFIGIGLALRSGLLLHRKRSFLSGIFFFLGGKTKLVWLKSRDWGESRAKKIPASFYRSRDFYQKSDLAISRVCVHHDRVCGRGRHPEHLG